MTYYKQSRPWLRDPKKKGKSALIQIHNVPDCSPCQQPVQKVKAKPLPPSSHSRRQAHRTRSRPRLRYQTHRLLPKNVLFSLILATITKSISKKENPLSTASFPEGIAKSKSMTTPTGTDRHSTLIHVYLIDSKLFS